MICDWKATLNAVAQRPHATQTAKTRTGAAALRRINASDAATPVSITAKKPRRCPS